ncbi:MAG: DNA-binding response OmpR family regulator [Lysobacterales bacterium]|jgi:DNA-binding response OmpR family regulator
MSFRILVVEDDPAIAIGLKDDLELEGYQLDVSGNGLEAVQLALSEAYDLMILDVMLPGKDGYDVCREVRQQKPNLPIIMLTSRSHEAEKVLGLELGADDYVTKPFSPLELRARIKALLRRSTASESVHYRFSNFVLDLERVELKEGERIIELTALEFKLLGALIRNAGRVLNRNQILDLVWGSNAVLTDRVIDTHIANLRKKLEPNGSSHISSIRGMGYRFDS